MPTKVQIEELCEECMWTWTTMDGHDGYKVVGPNGNSIFLPAAGYLDDFAFRDSVDERMGLFMSV